MTIAIAVKVSEGLVLAADSASIVEGDLTVPGQPPQHGVVQVYSHATKVTQVGEWPVGVMTWGAAQIGSRTIESHVQEYANGLDGEQSLSVEQIAQGLFQLLNDRYAQAFGDQKPPLGLMVAGYSQGNFFPEQYLISFPAGDEPVQNVRPNNPDGSPAFGAHWYGMTDAIVRLYAGFDPNVVDSLFPGGPTPEIGAKLQQAAYPIIFEAMPLQDAIDFAAWLAEVTIGRFRFVAGVATVLGPVDIAVITRHSGFKWVRHKEPQISTYYTAVY